MPAVLGTARVLVLCRIVRRMIRSTLLGCLAGLLLAVDGLAIVLSRTALLDGPLAFFVLAAFGASSIDRDRARRGWPTGRRRRGPDARAAPGRVRPAARLAALAAARRASCWAWPAPPSGAGSGSSSASA